MFFLHVDVCLSVCPSTGPSLGWDLHRSITSVFILIQLQLTLNTYFQSWICFLLFNLVRVCKSTLFASLTWRTAPSRVGHGVLEDGDGWLVKVGGGCRLRQTWMLPCDKMKVFWHPRPTHPATGDRSNKCGRLYHPMNPPHIPSCLWLGADGLRHQSRTHPEWHWTLIFLTMTA